MEQEFFTPAPTRNRPPSSRGNVRVRERQTSEGVRTEPCLLAASRNDGLLSGRCPEACPLPAPGGGSVSSASSTMPYRFSSGCLPRFSTEPLHSSGGGFPFR